MALTAAQVQAFQTACQAKIDALTQRRATLSAQRAALDAQVAKIDDLLAKWRVGADAADDVLAALADPTA